MTFKASKEGGEECCLLVGVLSPVNCWGYIRVEEGKGWDSHRIHSVPESATKSLLSLRGRAGLSKLKDFATLSRPERMLCLSLGWQCVRQASWPSRHLYLPAAIYSNKKCISVQYIRQASWPSRHLYLPAAIYRNKKCISVQYIRQACWPSCHLYLQAVILYSNMKYISPQLGFIIMFGLKQNTAWNGDHKRKTF